MKKRLTSILLIMAVVFTTCFGLTSTSFADQGNCVNMHLTVDGRDPVEVKAYHASYTYNTYVSLEDLAYALKGTDKNFDIQYDGVWKITTGADYTGEAPQPFTTESQADPTQWDKISFDAYTLLVDGREYELRMYDNYKYSGFDGDVKGIYIKLIDAGMFLNMAFDYKDYDEMSIKTDEDFVIDLEDLEDQEYFHDLDGALVGDATTGEILYGYDENHQTEIASTSKLMTYLVVQEQIAAGKLALTDEFTITDSVYYEAQSEDGTLYADKPDTGKVMMKPGQTWTIHDLIAAMLLPSANEAGTALAEAVAGTEADFVKLMNEKAAELGMTTAKFYNPHGLPNYTNGQLTGKRQNKMSAADMFTMVSYIMEKYHDDIVKFTGQERIYLESLSDDVYIENEDGTVIKYGDEGGYTPYVNTTYGTLFRNIDNLIGLKTGSTNRSGSCLVGAMDLDVDGKTHTIVSVSFGGEDNRQRYESTTALLKYAEQYYARQSQQNAEIKAGVEATTIKATAKASGESIKVSWKKTGDYDVDGYIVYKATKKDGEYKRIGKTKKTTMTSGAKNVTDGKTYYYKIEGYRDVAGKTVYTKESNIASAKTKIAANVKAATVKAKATAYNNAVKVSWTKKSNGYKVDGYQVWRSTTGKKGTFKKVKTTTAASWKNTGLKDSKKYYYKVRGYRTVDGKKVYTQWSNTVSKVTK